MEKKLRVGKLNTKSVHSEHYREVQKKLSEDFQVVEFLAENPTEKNNIESYSLLYNSLLWEKRQKKQKLKTLSNKLENANKQKAKAQQLELKIKSWEGLKEQHCQHYEWIKMSMASEYHVNTTLHNEIVDAKNSLYMLKGDIGHLIHRNESTSLLQNKINKTQIVAADQLNKVATAFSKDKAETKELNQMQRKFYRKMRKNSAAQLGNLKKMKQLFYRDFVKKQELFARLSRIQKQGQLMARNGNNHKLITGKDQSYQSDSQNFLELKRLIAETIKARTALEEGTQFSLDPQDGGDAELSVEDICREYEYLNGQLGQDLFMYTIQLENRDHLHLRREQRDNLRSNPFLCSRFMENQMMDDLNKSYTCHLHKYAFNLKTIMLFLSHIYNNLELPNEMELYSEVKTANELWTISEQECPLQQMKTAILKPSCSNYISQLVNNYFEFELEEEYTALDHRFFHDLNSEIPIWIAKLLHQWRMVSLRRAYASANQPDEKEKVGLSLTEDTFEQEIHSNYMSVTDIGKESEVIEEFIIPHTVDPRKDEKDPNTPKVKEIAQAKRIQFLQDVDQNYHKMLKSTLKMEKENNKKHSEFLRTFKRAKFSYKDQILEERGFEATLMKYQVTSNTIYQHDPRLNNLSQSVKNISWSLDGAAKGKPSKFFSIKKGRGTSKNNSGASCKSNNSPVSHFRRHKSPGELKKESIQAKLKQIVRLV